MHVGGRRVRSHSGDRVDDNPSFTMHSSLVEPSQRPVGSRHDLSSCGCAQRLSVHCPEIQALCGSAVEECEHKDISLAVKRSRTPGSLSKSLSSITRRW